MKKIKKMLPHILLLLTLAMIVPTQAQAAVRINKKSVTLTVGKSTTLKVKGTKKKVKWTSNKKSVATVTSKGKVTAKKQGSAKITAKIGGKKYTCKVTVKPKKGKLPTDTDDPETPETTPPETPDSFTDETMAALSLVWVKETLKNPASLVVNKIIVGYEDQTYGDESFFPNVKDIFVDYNATNSYGAYVRGYATFCIYPKEGKPLQYLTHYCMPPGTYLAMSTYSSPSSVVLKQSKRLNIDTALAKMEEFWAEGKYYIGDSFADMLQKPETPETLQTPETSQSSSAASLGNIQIELVDKNLGSDYITFTIKNTSSKVINFFDFTIAYDDNFNKFGNVKIVSDSLPKLNPGESVEASFFDSEKNGKLSNVKMFAFSLYVGDDLYNCYATRKFNNTSYEFSMERV